MQLFDLPPELLEEILFHVSPTQLLARVSLSCRRLRDLLRSNSFWRRRYAALMRATPPSLSEDGGCSVWQRGCVEVQFSRRLCRKHPVAVSTTSLAGPTGGLDCVHLMYPSAHGAVGLVAAGCRDSSVYLWRRRSHSSAEFRSMRCNIMCRMEGHKGWVWCLTSHPHRPELLCSGGWDSTVHIWDAVVGKMVASISKEHRAAVLSLALPQPDCLVTASFDKKVREFDLRVPVSLVADHQEHRKSVLALACSETCVYSGGEDRSLCVWDRRNHRVLQTVKMSSLVSGLHCNYGKVSCSAQKKVTIFDSSQGTLTKLSSYVPNHQGPLTCVFHNLGMVATGSKDSTVAIHGSTPGHTHITTLEHHKRDITGLDCSLNTLALSSSDHTASLWTPNYP